MLANAPVADAQNQAAATKAFADCLLLQGRDGAYTSFDGGKSAIRLMGEACKAEWNAWEDQCIANGGADGGFNGCTAQALIQAQLALKMLGK